MKWVLKILWKGLNLLFIPTFEGIPLIVIILILWNFYLVFSGQMPESDYEGGWM